MMVAAREFPEHRRFVLLAVTCLQSACSVATLSPSPTTPTITTSSGTACTNPARSLRLATAVAGSPDPSDQAFVADQSSLFDKREFADPSAYPPGYHWKIDQSFKGTDVIALNEGIVPPTGLVTSGALVNITLSSEGAARLSADSTGAYQESFGSPRNTMAFFVGNEVIEAPSITSPLKSSLQLSIPSSLVNGETYAQIVSQMC